MWLSEPDFLMMSAVASVLYVSASTWGGGLEIDIGTDIGTDIGIIRAYGGHRRTGQSASIIFQF